MMVGRNDLPHVFQMTRSGASALHVGRMVARYARDRLRYRRGTRFVNGNALISKLAANAFKRGIPLWLNSPIVELVHETGRITGAIVERKAGARRSRPVVAWCSPAADFLADDELKGRVYRHVAAGKSHVSLPPPGNSGDGLRLAQSVGGTFHDGLHHPAAWAPASLVPQADGSTIPTRISSIAASRATSASTAAADAL